MKQVVQESVQDKFGLTKPELLELYRKMYLSRAVDTVQELWQRMGHSHFYIGSAGHEAFLAGVSLYVKPGVDWLIPYYRDLCLALACGQKPRDVFAAHIGSAEDPGSFGRQFANHFGRRESRIFTRSSPVGTQFLTGAGMGFAGFFLSQVPEDVRKKSGADYDRDEIVITGSGEAGTSQGEIWEALNFASIELHPCPVLYLVEDNEWGISVHVSEQTAGGCVADLLTGFRDKGLIWLGKVNGLDPIASAHSAREAIAWVRTKRKPAVLYAKVLRRRSHSVEDNEREYRPVEKIDEKKQQDPLETYPEFLIKEGIATASELEKIKSEVDQIVNADREAIEKQIETKTVPYPTPGRVLENLYSAKRPPTAAEFDRLPQPEGEALTMLQAINRCLHDEFEANPLLWCMGEDVGDVSLDEELAKVPGKGGVFGITKGLQKKFGRRRCFNSPLAEGMIVGIAHGAATRGVKPVVEIQFDDYFKPAAHQLAAEIATLRWRSDGSWSCPLVIRVASQGYTGGIGSIWHSQSNEAFYAQIPGIRVALPSTPSDAVGLLRTAIRCDDPVIFLEPKVLYRLKQIAQPYPGKDYTIPFGKARVVREGKDLTCVTWGIPVHMISKTSGELANEGTSVELIDLRTIAPWDKERVAESVKKTGKLLIVHGAALTLGFGAEIAATIAKECFDYLDAPIERLTGKDCPIGYGRLEFETLPQEADMKNKLLELARY